MSEGKLKIYIEHVEVGAIADDTNIPLTTKGTREFVGHCSIELSVPVN